MAGKPLAGARRAVKRCAVTMDLVLGHTPGVVILIYHRVGRLTQTETDLPMALFEEQMEVLSSSSRVVSLDTAMRMLNEDPPTGPDPIVITFDDGTKDFADCAMPVLERLDLPVTLYLATSFVEDGRSFIGDGVPLSWDATRDVLSTGLVTLGSHTHTHPRMDRLDSRAVAKELDQSIALIQDRLAVDPEHFAYPYSVPVRSQAEPAVRSRCRSAAVAGTRINRYRHTDPYRLQRAPIQTSDGMTYFHKKARGGMRLEDMVRTTLNSAAQVGRASLRRIPVTRQAATTSKQAETG